MARFLRNSLLFLKNYMPLHSLASCFLHISWSLHSFSFSLTSTTRPTLFVHFSDLLFRISYPRSLLQFAHYFNFLQCCFLCGLRMFPQNAGPHAQNCMKSIQKITTQLIVNLASTCDFGGNENSGVC